MSYSTVIVDDLTRISGIGPQTSRKLESLEIKSINDLIQHSPSDLSRRSGFSETTCKKWINRGRIEFQKQINLIKKIAHELLVSFKELPGFDQVKISEINNIYDMNSTTIAYYEVKFSSPNNNDNGYAIISATKKELPVVEFSHNGKTNFEYFNKRIPKNTEFKIIRFGPGYYAAESLNGDFLMGRGNRPSIIPKELQKHFRDEFFTIQGRKRKSQIKPDIDIAKICKSGQPLDYKEFKKAYKKPKTRNPTYHWKIVESPHSPCTYEYFWARGFENHTYFKQIPKLIPPNYNDHSSGCGATAWMNLIGWHDRNLFNLLCGDQEVNNPYIENLTMQLHDHLGTYEPWFTFGADEGFTWPSDMNKGVSFIYNTLGYDASAWFRHDWFDPTPLWIYIAARDAAHKGWPFIVGYFADYHYAVAYGVAECTDHGWQKHSWIAINPGWTEDDLSNKWIPMNDIFGSWALYYMQKISESGTVGHRVDTKYWSSGWTQAEPFSVAGNQYLFLFRKSDGTARSIRINSNGSIGDVVQSYNWSNDWSFVELYNVGNNTYMILVKKSNGLVHIREMNVNGTVGPIGSAYLWTTNWTHVKPFRIGVNQYLFRHKESNGAGSIYEINSDGTLGPEIQTYNWTSGWSTVEFFTIDDITYIFLLRKSNGEVRIHKMKTKGTLGSMVDMKNWSNGWTHALPFIVAGNQYLLVLRESDGTARSIRINSNGSIGPVVKSYNWSSGWSTAEFYTVHGSRCLFSLKKSNGTVQVQTMN